MSTGSTMRRPPLVPPKPERLCWACCSAAAAATS
ncbi:MAG: DUF3079 domain-containing protein [Verrucomicrobiaceae bacterium]|nr:DUF3079 domain-containing protein [Verrucomicrobiaceae bacterium]